MLCTYCKLNSISPFEVDHCDSCAEYLRTQDSHDVPPQKDTVKPKPKSATKKIYTVRIKTCSSPDIYWYNNHKNQLFDCEMIENENLIIWPHTKYLFRTTETTNTNTFAPYNPQRGFILPQDCVIMTERAE